MYIKNIIDVDNFSFIDKIKKIKIEGLWEISKVSFKCRIFNYLFCIQGSRYYNDFKPRLLVFVCLGFNAQIAYM